MSLVLVSCSPTYIIYGTDLVTKQDIIIQTKSDASMLCDTVVTDQDEIIVINKIELK